MMSPRTHHRLPYRIVNTPTVPGIRDHYHRPVLRKSGQGAVSIDQSRITIDYCRKEVSLPILSLPVIQPGKFHLLCEGDREGKGLDLIFCFRNNNCKFFPA